MEKDSGLIIKARERLMKETPEETSKRRKGILSKREEALEKIQKYQERTGFPTEEETEEHFIANEAEMSYDDYKKNLGDEDEVQ